jgi:leader peptidase (prepilin peptidase)/N-methyltransferase
MSIHLSQGVLVYCCVVAAALGACFGSFLNCAAWRIAHGEPFWKGRSHCPACGHTLGVPDLVPVFSWLFLRGRCRHCGERISPRYLLTELAFALLTMACLLRCDLTVLCLRNWVFLCCLFCLSLVDLENYTIPDGCLVISALAWAVSAPFVGMSWGTIGVHVLSGLGFGGVILLLSLAMDALLHKDSMGGGDIKLFAVMGLYLGPVASLFAVMLSCVFGLLFALLRRMGGEEGEQIPFGPSIAAATAFMLLWGEALVQWYLGLMRLA